MLSGVPGPVCPCINVSKANSGFNLNVLTCQFVILNSAEYKQHNTLVCVCVCMYMCCVAVIPVITSHSNILQQYHLNASVGIKWNWRLLWILYKADRPGLPDSLAPPPVNPEQESMWLCFCNYIDIAAHMRNIWNQAGHQWKGFVALRLSIRWH